MEKKLYKVSGKIPYLFGSRKIITEYVHAYSVNQALKIVSIRLQKKYPSLEIDLSSCKVEEINKKSPN